MADKATPAADNNGGEWERVEVGAGGDEWEFDNGPLIGAFLGVGAMQIEQRDGEIRDQSIYRFAPDDDPETIVILWGSAQLDAAFRDIEQGTRVKVAFQGERAFIDRKSGEPRRVKQYSVYVAK